MGKYMMRKAKFTDDVAVMEVPQSTTLGVRTRAKTLALQRIQSSSTAPPSPPPSDLVSDSSCYLELRSRRLQKPLRLKPQSCTQEVDMNTHPRSSSSRLRLNNSASSGSVKSASIVRPKVVEDCFKNRVPDETEHGFDLGIEASFGENNSDFQARQRSTRENTPCSFIREADVATPGSSTRQGTLDTSSWRNQNPILRNIPSAYEMEEFFTHAEQQQQRQFIDKYNFDIVADMPLPGRYDWVSVSQ